MAVTSEEVAAYEAHVEYLARRLTGIANAEFDDLRQEGLIIVWQTLERRLKPSTEVIVGRMIDWIRFVRRLQTNDAIAYEILLPIEDYTGIWDL